MTTKDQERKALEQIRKIVDELGENSYIGMAFEGCFEIAEKNIVNDLGCSMKQRCRSAEKEAAQLANDVVRLQKTNRVLMEENENIARKYDKEKESGTAFAVKYAELDARAEEYKQSALENWNKFRETEDKLEAANAEILKLKAKLYDYMVKEVN